MAKKKKKKVAITHENGFIRIVLPDSIGMDESVEIEKEITSQLSDKKEQIIIDFSMTNTLYSSGMGLLIRLQKITKRDQVSTPATTVLMAPPLLCRMVDLDCQGPVIAGQCCFCLTHLA